ncbi:MAG: maltose alpha-D-glucosyltransferase [Pseudohongiella sp.]|nr:maltose alpha-D-glucosyltransferase [Pseudohongiella sp.]
MVKRNQRKEFNEDPLWYKDAVIYQVHVKSFFDANNDGIGDFAGLIAKLDYIADLGVNTLWLLPFFPSPQRDDGYDISDYRQIHPDYGKMSDVRRFIAEAHKRSLRVIFELVINHTSDQHPWFERARRAKRGSAARNFYVWSDDDKKYADTRIIFLDTEKSNWTWDPVAGQYFWHRFYSHQPDLNFDNPQVLKEVLAIMRFWLNLGVDGLRLDAIPYLIERDGTNNENLPETHVVLKKIRAELDRLYPDRMLLAEANQWPEDTQLYFGGNENNEGDECHMAFHFPLMPRMYMALAQEDRFPITDILRQTPEIPANCQWAIFLRNHDELTLEMVTDNERDHLWNYYAADRRARINLGIRRRLAPLMERDRRRIELLHSLLLSMPGTPTLYYGDELGMGDNIFLGDRDGVRTPMQWSIDRNGGFSKADPARMVLPPIQDPLYGYHTVNVESQLADSHSLLNWTRRMLMVRKQQKAFGRGVLRMLAPANRRILAYLREYSGENGNQESILCVANLSGAAQPVELDLGAFFGKVPVEMTGSSAFPPVANLPYQLSLPPYGFYWFYLSEPSQMPSWHVEPPQPMPDMLTLVIKKQLSEVLESLSRSVLEREILPAYLSQRRWFAGAQQAPVHVNVAIPTNYDGHAVLLCEIEVATASGMERYQLPLGFVSETVGHALPRQLGLARVRRGREVGFLTDAFSMKEFLIGVVRDMQAGRVIRHSAGSLVFSGSSALSEMANLLDTNAESGTEVVWIATEQSNSSALIANSVVLKLLRQVHKGIHPEIELGGFLTRKGFSHCAPLLGKMEAFDVENAGNVAMVLQGYLDNQGDAWLWTQAILKRAIRDVLAGGLSRQENQYTALSELENFARNLGQRLGAMHILLASDLDDPDFKPAIIDAAYAQNRSVQVLEQLEQARHVLEHQREVLDASSQRLIEKMPETLMTLRGDIRWLADETIGGALIRVHGDLHLGQILVVQDDAYFIDFEGEPDRPLAQRRARHSPYKDVAGILRSFDYAAATAHQDFSDADRSAEAEQARQSVLTSYLEKSTEMFLDAYRLATDEMPHDWKSRQGGSAALLLFSIEKACYEIMYEVAHRPGWVEIPLRGLLNLSQQAQQYRHGVHNPNL